MRILNVAEKNIAAKNISNALSGGKVTQRESYSRCNKIYEFDCVVFDNNHKMIMTSVSGHLLDLEFYRQYRKWNQVDPASLFNAPLEKITLPKDYPIKKTLESEIKNCSKLIIWTDCDREGENIGFEIIEVCKAANQRIEVYRAVFSDITSQSVRRALVNLQQPNIFLSNAVEVRRELDLRIGAAFTRFQTIYLRKAFPSALQDSLVSYGSCQFPTLGFVADRFKAISNFKPEKFWGIAVEHKINNISVRFSWKRNALFEKLACEVLYDMCVSQGTARVEKCDTIPKKKYRPKPLETTEFQKLASRKLKINAQKALKIAEGLYLKGLISYPRTETTYFSKNTNLAQLVELQTADPRWGVFAERVLRDGPDPFQGQKSDHAHPPIHPIKYSDSLIGDEKKIYELVVRHFLACLSKHAEGLETTVEIDIAKEKFLGTGLMITARNYLDVYPYDNWSEKEIYAYNVGDVFRPEISMQEGETTPPPLLTEADLIALMEKHGIGTDATHAEHIETIKERLYVGLQDGKYFVPRTLGMGLVEGYNSMGCAMSKPDKRAELEDDLKKICEGKKLPEEVLEKHISVYKELFLEVQRHRNLLVESIQHYIKVESNPVEPDGICDGENLPKALGKCPQCHSDILLKHSKSGKMYLGCSSYPSCKAAIWFPSFVKDVTATEDTCPKCGPNTFLLRFNFEKGSCYYPPNFVGCVGGCDMTLLNLLTSDSKLWMKTAEKVPPAALRQINVSHNEIATPETPARGSPPNCKCGIPAMPKTAKNPGVNQGKVFYTCGLTEGSRCDFFQWKLEDQSQGKVTRQGSNESEFLFCYCGLPCRRRTKMKEGLNQGRDFFSCSKDLRDSSRCDFFQWADIGFNDSEYGKPQNMKFQF